MRRVDDGNVRSRRSAKRGPNVFGAIAGVLVLLAVIGLVTVNHLLTSPDHDIAPGAEIEIVIERGSGTEAIAQALSDAGIATNALAFRVKARREGVDGELKAGTYQLVTGMSDDEIIAALRRGPEIVFFDVPIPEGFTAEQIATRFAARTGVDEDELLALVKKGAPGLVADYPFLKGAYRDSLEGYLFPATYRVREDATAQSVVRMMLDKFVAETGDLDLSHAKSKNLTFHDVIVIASAIEREAQLEKERPLVASVIYNRLKAGMRLQLCATVLYKLPGKTSLTLKDLELDTPYNTYKHAGLPPGPISNPGIASIKAAAKPPKTEYLYYVLTGKDGSHTYTANYADFLKAKKVNQQVFGN